MPVGKDTRQYAGRKESCELVGSIGDHGPGQLLDLEQYACMRSVLEGRRSHDWRRILWPWTWPTAMWSSVPAKLAVCSCTDCVT